MPEQIQTSLAKAIIRPIGAPFNSAAAPNNRQPLAGTRVATMAMYDAHNVRHAEHL